MVHFENLLNSAIHFAKFGLKILLKKCLPNITVRIPESTAGVFYLRSNENYQFVIFFPSQQILFKPLELGIIFTSTYQRQFKGLKA